jgi:hypothetical protein
MAGEHDRLTPPSHAKRIAEMLPALERLIILPDAGHMDPLERPREVNEALLELAGKLSTTVGAAPAAGPMSADEPTLASVAEPKSEPESDSEEPVSAV